jgi:hypothetical protein
MLKEKLKRIFRLPGLLIDSDLCMPVSFEWEACHVCVLIDK